MNTALRYIPEVATITLDVERCNGCRICTLVCPHGVIEIHDKRARLTDRDACMECGACARNCEQEAIALTPGVGCAGAILKGWILRTEPTC